MKSIDYSEIMLRGYADANTREHLSEYLLRKFKEVESLYKAPEFFDGCLAYVDSLENAIRDRFNKRKDNLNRLMYNAKGGTLTRDGKLKTAEQNRETINECKQELSEISINDFAVNVQFKGQPLSIWEKDIPQMKQAIIKAIDLHKLEDIPPPPDKRSFIDYFKFDEPKKAEKFAEALKKEFSGDKGKTIALMIYSIKDYLTDKPIVKKEFYKKMAEYFGQRIGSDASINRYLNNGLDITPIPYLKAQKKDIEKIKSRVGKTLKNL